MYNYDNYLLLQYAHMLAMKLISLCAFFLFIMKSKILIIEKYSYISNIKYYKNNKNMIMNQSYLSKCPDQIYKYRHTSCCWYLIRPKDSSFCNRKSGWLDEISLVVWSVGVTKTGRFCLTFAQCGLIITQQNVWQSVSADSKWI